MEPDADIVLDLLFEWGQLKRLPRSGWWRAGVDDPESVAAHNLRAAQLAYVLAVLEGHPEPERVCTTIVFHEIGETRVSDLDTIAKRYTERAEERATRDQLEPLGELGDRILEFWLDCEEVHTDAGRIARDADKLEAAITGREYVDIGYASAQEWIDSTRELLETESALKLLDALEERSFTDWWRKMAHDEDQPARDV